jgi:hypothetical protein
MGEYGVLDGYGPPRTPRIGGRPAAEVWHVALSAFGDPMAAPSAGTLAEVLGEAAAWWSALVDGTRAIAGEISEAWSFGGPRTGWSMRLLRGDRVLAYLTPQAGKFLVGVVLGEKAIAAATAGLASEGTLAVVEAAPRYAEGRGVRIIVETEADLAVATELARIKILR